MLLSYAEWLMGGVELVHFYFDGIRSKGNDKMHPLFTVKHVTMGGKFCFSSKYL